MEKEKVMAGNLTETIEQEIRQLKITSLDISFNELSDMYVSEELLITPNYQRTFRWDKIKQSRFIESLLLEMPIPPIYAIEINDGIYELIDGLQRISSYLNYRGLLKKQEPEQKTEKFSETSESDDEEDDDSNIKEEDIYINGFALDGCDIIPELNGTIYNDLPAGLKIKLKRSFVRMEVLRKGINPELKYHMFKRLNTGGEILTAQELRNCTIRIIDNKFIDFINNLSHNLDFQATIEYVSSKQKNKKFAEELVLRFFALKNDRASFSHDVATFLTRYMEKVAMTDADLKKDSIFDYDNEKIVFQNTFRILNQSLGKEAFATYKSNSSILSGFNVYQFEAITVGMQSIYNKLVNGSIELSAFSAKIKQAKTDSDFKNSTVGGGKNSSGVLDRRCEYIVKTLGEII